MAVLTKLVKPGDKVDVIPTVKRNDPDSQQKQYRTVVYDVVSDDEIQISMPMEGSQLILLSVGLEYELCFYTDSGLYQCLAVVRNRYKSNNVFVVAMELTGGLRKFQRREYYRLNCILDMKCKEMDSLEVQEFLNHVEFFDTDFVMSDGVIVDISGGGIRFISKVRYNEETKILFNFNLNIGNKDVDFKTIGQIIASAPIENRRGEYENRVKFLNMDADDRENIIRFIFEEERRIRKKNG